jgi:hypothetical protein
MQSKSRGNYQSFCLYDAEVEVTKHHLKGKNQGLNGTIIASAGYPETYGLSGTLNYKSKIFTTQGYNDRSLVMHLQIQGI